MKRKKKYENAAWNFQLDNVERYAYWENAFTKEECEKIIKIAYKKGMTKGLTIGNPKIRSSEICWLYSVDDLDWAFQKITDIVLNLNKQFFNFDIFGIHEGFQFTNYKSPSGKYGKHVDKLFKGVVRKLSISVQLTDPKKYKGGELYIYDGDKGEVMKQEQGTLIMFPSYTLHEVKPVTKGERNSLVVWVTGKQFK